MKIKYHLFVYVSLSAIILLLAIPKQKFVKIAETNSISQIRLLQNSILDKHETLQLSKENDNYILKVNVKNKLDYYKAITYLAETEGIDSNVKLNVAIKNYKNYDKYIKHLTKQLYYIISNIEGVSNHNIQLHQNEQGVYDKINITITTNNYIDTQKIERTIRNIFETSIPEFDKNNLKINMQYDNKLKYEETEYFKTHKD